MKAKGSPSRAMARAVPLGLLLALAGLFTIAAPVAAAPVVTVSPTSGAVGTEVVISGAVFDSYKGDIITITFDGEPVPEYSPYEIPESGDFSIPFTIPASMAPGSYLIHVEGAVGSSQFSAETVFRVEAPTVTLDRTEGPVGASVIVSGRGFYSGAPVTVYFANPNEESQGTETTDETGHFTHNFLIPAGTGGPHTVSAANSQGNTAATTFTVMADLMVNVASGGPGDLVHLTGAGYGFRSNVTVKLGTATVATARSGDHGEFEIDFNVPELPSGPYDITAEDVEGNLDLTPFTVSAGASLSVLTGAVGSDVTAHGSGFKPGGTATIDFGTMRVATVKLDVRGGFTTTFGVPAVGAGEHTVSITDGALTRQIVYTIESDAPLVPAAILPADGAATRANAYLDWENVSDPSLPVTYHLQVAEDSGFTALIVDREDLSESEYSFGVTEILTVADQPVSYYWRVRAEDGAWNLSEWSPARSFVISPPPAPSIVETPTETAAEPGEESPTGSISAPVGTSANVISLEWEPVTAATGTVTYTVQVSETPDFSDPVLEKAGLTSSDYLLSEADRLGLKNNVPYYWRVKAVDADGVSGEWSEPGTFTAGTSFRFPAWGIWIIAGVGVAALIFLAFRFGRRTAYGSPD